MRAYRPPFAKSRPLIIPAPDILCRAIICDGAEKHTLAVHTRLVYSKGHTVFVRVLKTRTEPAEVPAKIYLPVGSKRTTVMTDLMHAHETCRSHLEGHIWRTSAYCFALQPHSPPGFRTALRGSDTVSSGRLSRRLQG